MIESLKNRKERDSVLITLSVSRGSNLNAVVGQLRREAMTARNIKDKGTMRKVLQAISKLLRELPKEKVGDGFVAFAAYDGV